MANNLKLLRDSRNWSQEEAATAMQTTRNQYAKLEAGSRRLSDKWIDRASAAFGVDEGDIVTSRQEIPVEGLVGAGSARSLFSEGQGPIDYVPAPAGSTDRTKALEIRGTSLGAAFNGWLLFYDDVRRPVTDDLIGRMCVVGLRDGDVLVKILRRGGVKKRFTLDSNTEPPIYDVDVEWAALVSLMKPRDK